MGNKPINLLLAKDIKISICIITYNRENLILRAINSALKQIYENYEIIVVDDGSTDETRKKVASISSDKISYFRFRHCGAAAARNKAIEVAKGEYILWLDSDDEIVENCLAEYLRVIQNNRKIEIIYCNNLRIFSSGIKQKVNYRKFNGKISPFELLEGPVLANGGTLIKKDVFMRVGSYNKSFLRAHDYEFWARAIKSTKFYHLDKTLYIHYLHKEGSLSPIYHEKTDLSFERKIVNFLVTNYSLEDFYPEIDWKNLSEQSLNEIKSSLFLKFCKAFLKWKDYVNANKYLMESKKLKKYDEQLSFENHINYQLSWKDKKMLPITAIIAAYNEGDVIYHVVKNLVEQDIQVYFIDHNSTDNTVEQVSKFLGKGVVHIEKFPEESGMDIPNDIYSWRYILKRKEQISQLLGDGWYIHTDADEFREAPFSGLNLREGIEKVDSEGYNAINFKIYDFKPIDDSFIAGEDVREYLTHYSKDIHQYNKIQVKCWKNFGQEINLWESGGHNIEFLERKIYPLPFILRHYAIRSQEHGLKKIFEERKKRYDAEERKALWHQHYDEIKNEGHNFIEKKENLISYNKEKAVKEINDLFGSNIEGGHYYQRSRQEIQDLISPTAKIILDVGCGEGVMASELKQKLNAEVWGVEFVDTVSQKARNKIDKVLTGTIEENLKNLPDKYFDTIIFADVLEHLTDPEKILTEIKTKLKPGGEIVTSIPNVRHWSVVLDLLQGNWEYQDEGLLDRTHLRFFTKKSIVKMVERLGGNIADFKATNVLPTEGLINEIWEKITTLLSDCGLNTSTLYEEGINYQYLLKINFKSISTIVPLYNNWEYTEQFIFSLENSKACKDKLILVDNNSSDKTSEMLSKLSSKNETFKVITNSQNLGFPKAINQGILESDSDYILIANNDIIIPEGTVERMVEVLNSDPRIGIVGPVSNSVSGVQLDQNTDYKTIEEMHKYAEKVRSEYSGKIVEFPRVAFLCTLIKREVFEKIGGLDERFTPGNYEDDDFCLRAQMAGFKTVIARDVFIHHFGSKSFKADGEAKYAERLKINEEKFVNKWGATPDQIWLQGVVPGEQNIFIPIDKNSLVENYQRAQIAIENQEFDIAFNHISALLNNKDLTQQFSNSEIEKIKDLHTKLSKLVQ